MKLVKSLMTKNPCYVAGQKITVKGLMLHSVGVAQPSARVFINNWNVSSYDRACVHAFIDANSGVIYQTLPWNHRGWHCGASGNNTHIGVEMCEPDCIKYEGGVTFGVLDESKARKMVERTTKAAVELFAMLCKKYNLNPLKKGVIVSHKEGYELGMASDHKDPEHLWKQLGMSYDINKFRMQVKAEMERTATTKVKTIKKTKAAKSRDKTAAKGRQFVASRVLKLRTGAGSSYPVLDTVRKGTKIVWYGYYDTSVNGKKWYYVEFNGKKGYLYAPWLKTI